MYSFVYDCVYHCSFISVSCSVFTAHFILVHCSMFSFTLHATKCDRHYMEINGNEQEIYHLTFFCRLPE